MQNRLLHEKYFVSTIDIRGQPEVLRKKDFESVMSTNRLFARKFDVTEDEDVLAMIDRVIL